MNAKQTIKRENFTAIIQANGACFRACTSAINMCVTGLSSDELRKKHALGKRDSIRSVLTKEQVEKIVTLEEWVTNKLSESKDLTTFDIVDAIFSGNYLLFSKGTF